MSWSGPAERGLQKGHVSFFCGGGATRGRSLLFPSPIEAYGWTLERGAPAENTPSLQHGRSLWSEVRLPVFIPPLALVMWHFKWPKTRQGRSCLHFWMGTSTEKEFWTVSTQGDGSNSASELPPTSHSHPSTIRALQAPPSFRSTQRAYGTWSCPLTTHFHCYNKENYILTEYISSVTLQTHILAHAQTVARQGVDIADFSTCIW